MKKCCRCKQLLSLKCFGSNRSKPDGLATECRKCKSEQDKSYHKKNKVEIHAQKREYYCVNKEHIVAKSCAYAKDHPKEHNARCTIAKNKVKLETFRKYCDEQVECRSCKEVDIDILSIDHINGNGAAHRREIGLGVRGGYNFYRWLKKNNYPEGFQVLCFNCQFRKRAEELRPDNRTHLQEVRACYARKVKVQCLDAYGGRQCECGEQDLDVLTLDHVNDDGANHRRETNTRGYNFYIMLRKNGFPSEVPLQVLCLNCQIKKRQVRYNEGKGK